MARIQFNKRPQTDYIVVHCAATKPSMDVGVREIRQWHMQQGWLDVGYHYVIRRDGTIEEGRPHDTTGSHVKGFNSSSVGICLVGGINDSGKFDANFTSNQLTSLIDILDRMQKEYPKAKIVGHHTLDAGKACPSFNVSHWLETRELVTSAQG